MKGFYRLAAAVPVLRVGDPTFNVDRIVELYHEAVAQGAAAVLFPELAVTGYSCGDMFEQIALTDAADAALARLIAETEGSTTVVIVGTPLRVESRLFNAAAVIADGCLLGFPLKEYLPNYREFYEKRQFNSVREFEGDRVVFNGVDVPAGSGLVFCAEGSFRFGVEICEDLWSVIPPSSNLALGGAQVVFNLTAGNELVSKADFRRSLVINQSARISGTYVMAGAGVHESTSDVVFSGHALIAVNGRLVAENERFSRQSTLIYSDIKPAWSDSLRASWTSFNDCVATSPVERLPIPALLESPDLKHFEISSRPFVPSDDAARSARCHEIFSIQTAGLAKRVEHTGAKRLILGVSGGLDSTLALLVCAKTCDLLGLPRSFICAITMPGFGTTKRTKGNAETLAKTLGVELRTIRIDTSVEQHFKDIGHDAGNQNVVFENSQARERTQILMDIANAEGGILVGTGDLSEIALGWSTFNGDQMSMYNVNCSVPKTLIRYLVEYDASISDDALAGVLRDVIQTPVSPELLPGNQHTELLIGRYELHDFFLYYFMKFGETPDTLAALAAEAFGDTATAEEIATALKVFLSRFLSQQFKRNTSPDGPKVGTMALSPRGDWRCPSDMSGAVWNR